MNKPEVLYTEGVVSEDRSNGSGYIRYEPIDPKTIDDVELNLRECVEPRFLEFSTILGKAVTNDSVLLEGAPGSGKSNICQDLVSCSQQFEMPFLRIALHINAGTLRKIDKTQQLLTEFRNKRQRNEGFFILDNVDYVGYKGHRTRAAAATYAEILVPQFIEIITENNHAVTIGTSHDERWRNNKWKWGDPAIDDPAEALLEAFHSRHKFTGDMSDEALIGLLESRGCDTALAQRTVKKLGESGNSHFFMAQHIDLDLMEANPSLAYQQVEEGREKRYGN